MRALTLLALAALAACSKEEPNVYQGYVEGEFVYVASSEPGRLDRMAVSRGQKVAASTPLFALEAVSETAALRQAQEQLAAAQAELENIKTGKRPPEVDVTRAQIAQASAEERKAEAALARDEAQFRIGGISKAQLDETRAQAESAAARVRELNSQLTVAKLPERTDQIRAQAAQVNAAKAAVEQAQWRLDQKSVMARTAGTVFDTMYREGEWVAAGNPVVRMLPPQNVKVRFFVPETIVGGLAPGGAVTVRCDGCREAVRASITYVSTESEYTPPVIYSNETRAKLTYMIEAHPELAQAALLRPGQPVAVRLQ